jgi:hypothetical protein
MSTPSTVHGRNTMRLAGPSASLSRGSMNRGDGRAWHARRREVIDQASGICSICGLAGADTAFRDWNAEDLLAAHTRCVVGLGPPRARPDHHTARSTIPAGSTQNDRFTPATETVMLRGSPAGA